jgi:hypothetical protein
MPELEVSGSHLRERDGVVERRDGDVAAVEDRGPGRVRVYACAGVEASEGGLACRGCADGAGAEACS